MPNVVIVRNTYPDDAALNNVIHYALNKAAFYGGHGITPEIGAAQMQMQFVKRAFYQTDALQLKHFFITYSHDEAAYIDFEEIYYFEKLRTHIAKNPPDFGDGDSVLTLFYEAYAESNKMDDGTIKEDFNELYRQMNGMELREMDKIIYPVCTLCRDHQRSGFVEGVKVGIRLKTELEEE